MSTTEDAPASADGGGRTRRRGIVFFDPPAESPPLHETGMMSMPTLDPPAGEQLMEWGLSGGNDTRVLFRDGEDGLSLVWAWFGPHHVLPRHSHDADCLYYVVAGEAHLGNRVVPAGGGFFVPADAPYAYTAGPDGIQVLEFRNAGSFDMKITESLPRWDHIVEVARQHGDEWKQANPAAAD